MSEEANSTASESASTEAQSTDTADSTSSVDTQQVDSQSTEQADTTQLDASVTDSMKIEKANEPENSDADNQFNIDDIVNRRFNDELSEEELANFSEKELQYIDMVVDGIKAKQEKNNNEIYSLVGGESSYQELQEWGVNNLSEDEQAAFNEALFSNNMNLAKLAVEGLKARYEAANGKSPDRVIEGGGSANTSNKPYSSVTEYINETQTLEYKRNPEYRAEVESRRNLSGF